MDQLLSPDNEEPNEECNLPTVVNSSEENVFESSPNRIGNESTSGSSNENILSEKPPVSCLEAESRTGENDVSSTSCTENEVISNQNDPVENQHSTCESVQDFEQGGDSSSEEVEAECASKLPNVDNNADSNMNILFEQCPSASDHIELPSASDLIELPSSSCHTQLPSTSDHVEQSSASHHMEVPTTSDDTELPLESDRIDVSPVSLPCAVIDTSAEGCANTKAIYNPEVNPIAEAVSSAVASPDIETVSNAESCCNTEIVTNAESCPNTKAITEAGTDAVADPTDVVTNAGTNPTSEVVSNTETNASTEVDNAELNPHTEAVINPDSSHQLNEIADDLSKVQNVCDTPDKESHPLNDETLNRQNNFLPTIVAIRGGCTDVLEKTSDPSSSNSLHEDVSSSTSPAMPNLNIVSVLGGCKEVNPGNEISNAGCDTLKKLDPITPTVLDNEETDTLKNCPDYPIDIDTTIKQEPHDYSSDNESISMATEHGTNSVTSEIPIQEDELKNIKTENPDVICIEASSQIPAPIPIKTESSIDCSNIEASPNKSGKCTAKKRLTRSNPFQSLSSSLDVDGALHSKNHLPENVSYSTAGYTCHLCNTVFQEHELLNEHMDLHRNNSLVVQNRSKTTKMKMYSCDTSQKQSSSSQSQQQQIYRNEKPFVSSVRQNDFRRLQSYRIGEQNHKAQQKGIKEQPDKSVVRCADFGRLVGPLFMKETLWHQEKDTSSCKNSSNSSSNKKTAFRYVAKEPVSPQPRFTFDQQPFKTNVKSSPAIVRIREPSPDSRSDEECPAVKSYSNIESVVMNAAKIIVKLDNVDTSVLKRKLQTPDISIEQAPKKCRIMLSPIAEKCNVKLDEIENIPMDLDDGEIDLAAGGQMDDHRDSYLNKNHVETTDSSECPCSPTTNEYDSTSAEADACGSTSRSQTLKPDLCKTYKLLSDSFKTAVSPPKQSNVIFMEAPPSSEMGTYEDEAIDSRLDDAFDTAFQKVATRRLALLRKRAAENGGKVGSCYLLGPLFWHKALRRAQKQIGNGVANVDITFSSCNGSKAAALRMETNQFGGRSRFDNRRTNDPTKLQLRAERKFKYLLELAKMLSDLNSVNLTGPLFWRRTLRLAGVHRGEDLRMHVNVTAPTLEGIVFVNDSGQRYDFDAELVNTEVSSDKPLDPVQSSSLNRVQSSLSDQVEASMLDTGPVQPSPTLCVQPSPSEVPTIFTTVSEMNGLPSCDQPATGGLQLTNNVTDDVLKVVDKMQPATVHPKPSSSNAATQTTEVASLSTDSILYESLTKPTKKQQQSTTPESIPSRYPNSSCLFVANEGSTMEPSLASHSEVVENGAQSNHPELTDNVAVDEGIVKLETIDPGSMVLNVDNGLQLIPAGDQVAMAGGQNFVLVSDDSGTMQYMVNVASDNFKNFELGDASGGEQVGYIQFAGENYAAVQFVQEDGIQLQSDDDLKGAQILVDSKVATYLMADAGATGAFTDPNHIGEELSDFLNLDYGNILKNGSAGQSILG